MAGLVPAIHVFRAEAIEGVDARDKPGHDDEILRFLPKIGANHVGGPTVPPANSC